MSLRYFSVRLFKNGRYILQAIYKRKIVTNCEIKISPIAPKIEATPKPFGLRNVGYQARRLFIDTVLHRVTSSLASDLKKKATTRLLSGDAAPFFAFIGVSLATGSGILSREDELESLCLEIRDAITKFQWNVVSIDANEAVFSLEDIKLDRLLIGPPIAKGSSAVVYAARLKDQPLLQNISNLSEFPFALKMMFNYDIQSNAMSILRGMYREAIPARRCFTNDEITSWESSFPEKKINLPPHPNIVAMYSVFADYVPHLSGSMMLYPDALPSRLNPEGYGRNMSLFLLMKRYNYSLADYLKLNKLSIRDSILILAQLLEGVTHINLYGVAHRDLKSDNILVDSLFTEEERTVPVVVVTDFGCCLADYVNGLQIPYNSDQIEKAGNAALMAPEIALQKPGAFSFLNYTKSDVWAVGTIAYEIFGMENPFYGNGRDGKTILRNTTYKETQLPEFDDNVPHLIKMLIKNLLVRNPNTRLTPEVAANICQLYLWAPSEWLKSNTIPKSTDILQWLLCLTTKVLYEGRLPDNLTFENKETSFTNANKIQKVAQLMTKKSTRRMHPEYVLISSFLGRVRLAQIRQALNWIQSVNNN